MMFVLNNNVEIPRIGFGTYPMKGEELTNAVVVALECGYRMFDTAHNYGNEEDLGKSLNIGLKRTGIKREEVFVNTKIDEEGCGGRIFDSYFYKKSKLEHKDIFGIVKSQVEMSLRKLQTDYLDSVLIHWPYPDYLREIWKSLELLYQQGLIRSIGVANCRERHLQKVIDRGNVVPMINQVQISPVNTMRSLSDYCKGNNILLQIYSPIMLLRTPKLKDNKVLFQLSVKYDVTPSQIVLKWNLQHGYMPIVKSSNPNRIKQNISLDFELDDSDMERVNSLNENYQYLPESIYCPGY